MKPALALVKKMLMQNAFWSPVGHIFACGSRHLGAAKSPKPQPRFECAQTTTPIPTTNNDHSNNTNIYNNTNNDTKGNNNNV